MSEPSGPSPREAFPLNLCIGYVAERLAAYRDHLDVADADERLALLPTHNLAAQGESVAGAEDAATVLVLPPAEAAGHRLLTVADCLLRQGNAHQARHQTFTSTTRKP